MDDLIKALKCYMNNECHISHAVDGCDNCKYKQTEYEYAEMAIADACNELEVLEKSNRNWRRKCQRLRAQIKSLQNELEMMKK